MTFGEKVREARKKAGLSQAALANEIGVTLRTVRGWEVDGRYPFGADTYEKLSRVLDCELDYLMSNDEIRATEAIKSKSHTSEARRAKAVLNEARRLFASDIVTKKEKLSFLQDIQNIFLNLK